MNCIPPPPHPKKKIIIKIKILIIKFAGLGVIPVHLLCMMAV